LALAVAFLMRKKKQLVVIGITNVITLSSIIMISIFICTLCIGDLNIQIWLKKGLWIFVSAFIGDIFGKL